MKKIVLSVLVLSALIINLQAQVAINTTGALPNSSAQLDVSATDKGLLIPRMTSANRAAIVSPANGLFVYDTDTKSQWFYSTQFSRWLQVIDSTKDMWTVTADVVHNKLLSSVGLGTSTPISTLHLHNTTAPSLRFTNAATGNSGTDGTDLRLIIDEWRIENFENTSTNFITDGAVQLTIGGNNGYLGIAGTVPTSPLSFSRTVGEKINIGNVSAAESFGIGVAPATLQVHAARSNDRIQFGIGKAGAGFVELMSIEPPLSDVKLTNKMTRQSVTGIANVLPVAYGRINTNGTVANSGTGNFTVVRTAIGQYRFSLSDPDFATHPEWFTMVITPFNFVPEFVGGSSNSTSKSTIYHNIDFTGPNVFVRMFQYVVQAIGVGPCDGCVGTLASTVFNNYVNVDCGFSFWIYKSN